MRIVLKWRTLACLAITLTVPSVFAQSERGTISGLVKDPSGAVIAGAKVTVTNTATNQIISISTTEAGDYAAISLQVGSYRVRVEKDGFRPAVISGVVVDAANNARADVTLEVGSTTTAVQVQAAAVQLATENAKTSSAVTNKLVDELPLVVGGTLRSPFDLASLTPEAKNLGGDNGFILGGGQAASYGTNLDGVSANTTRALSKSWVSTNSPSLEADHRVHGRHQRLQAGIRPRLRRRHELRFEVRNQSVPRLGLRVPA